MSERWRPIPGYEGKYEVSDLGRVRSVARTTLAKNRWGTITQRRYPGCELRAYVNVARGGYRYVNLHVNGQQHMRRVCGLVASAFIGPRPTGHQTRHLNGVAHDDRVANLCYGTAKENALDKERHGTIRRGAAHPTSCLSSGQVAFLRGAHNRVPKRLLADALGVSVGHVSNIQNGWRWRYA